MTFPIKLESEAAPSRNYNEIDKSFCVVQLSKHVEEISHSHVLCSNFLIKCFERNHKRCSDPQKFP